MKRVSAKLFFSVMWKGVCQALNWFFGLLGYKRKGKYAKVIWGIFATNAAILWRRWPWWLLPQRLIT